MARLGWVVTAIALAVGFWAAHSLITTIMFVNAAGTVDGEVEELIWHENSDGENMAAPLVVFTVEGQRYYYTGSASHPPAFEVGESVEMLYNPNAPSDARINTLVQLYLWPFLKAVFFLAILSMGTAMRRNDPSMIPSKSDYYGASPRAS